MYRTVDCGTWDDPWFADLDPEAKLLFLYFLTNRRSTAAGCFEITMRAIAFETGMQPSEVERHLGDSLKSRIQWFPDHQVIFVRNFYRHQSASSNKTNFRASAMKVLAEMPAVVQATVGDVYPDLRTEEPTHPQPIPNPSPTLGDKEEEEETVEVEVAVEGTKARATARTREASPSEPFEALVALCRATGADVAELSGSVKNKQLGKAKQLLADGLTLWDIGRLAGYCASQSWRTSPVDMFTLEKERGKWELAGKPASEPTKAARASPFAGIDEFEQRVNGTHEAEPEYVEATWRAS